MHHAGVGFELDLGGGDDRFQLFSSEGPEADWDHGVHLPMALQDGDVLVHAVICRLQRGRKRSGVPRRLDGEQGMWQVLYLHPHTHHLAAPLFKRPLGELLTQRLLPCHQMPPPTLPPGSSCCPAGVRKPGEQIGSQMPTPDRWQSPDLCCALTCSRCQEQGHRIKPLPRAPRASHSPGLTAANSGGENPPPINPPCRHAWRQQRRVPAGRPCAAGASS